MKIGPHITYCGAEADTDEMVKTPPDPDSDVEEANGLHPVSLVELRLMSRCMVFILGSCFKGMQVH